MPKQTATFGGYSPERGSKDAEDAWVEGEEAFQERMGGDQAEDYEDFKEEQLTPEQEDQEREERERKYQEVYVRRMQAAGDSRSESEIAQEWQEMQWDGRQFKEFMAQKKAEGSRLDLHGLMVEFFKEKSPSFKAYLEKRLETVRKGYDRFEKNLESVPWNSYIQWINGLDTRILEEDVKIAEKKEKRKK